MTLICGLLKGYYEATRKSGASRTYSIYNSVKLTIWCLNDK